VVRIPGYRSEVLGSIPVLTLEVVGLGRGPLSHVRITEDLLERKIGGSGAKTDINSGRDQLS
jgi:hypothetical protein